MGIKYDCIVKNGTYTDKTGAEKNRWQKIGVCVETKQGGLAVKLETIPVTWDGWISLAEPKPKESSGGSLNTGAFSGNVGSIEDDSVPF
jgi:hypothetical protein